MSDGDRGSKLLGLLGDLSASFQNRHFQQQNRSTHNAGSGLFAQNPLPHPSILRRHHQIVVGVLLKQINLGWRPRLFVLYHGILSCYKVIGPDAVNVAALLDGLRSKGDLYTVGAEVGLLEMRVQREKSGRQKSTAAQNTHASNSPSNAQPATIAEEAAHDLPVTSIQDIGFQPHSEVHMQVATVRESKSDGRKIHIHSGTLLMRLRAETPEDRWVWMEALNAAKGSWEGFTPTMADAFRYVQLGSNAVDEFRSEDAANYERHEPVPMWLMNIVHESRERLKSLNASEAVETCVEDLMRQFQEHYLEWARTEESKRKALIELVYQLDDQKRQLETALVVESGAGTTRGLEEKTGRQARKLSYSTQNGRQDASYTLSGSPVNGQAKDVSASSVTGSGSDELNAEMDEEASTESEEEFFECEFTSVHARMGSGGGSMTDLLSLEHAALQEGHGRMSPISGEQLLTSPEKLGQGGFRNADSGPTRSGPSSEMRSLAHIEGEFISPEVVPDWIKKEGPSPKRRTALPSPAQPEKSVSLWSLIKEMVGKDLTRVCLPVYFNEPLSALQKTAEDLEYSHLLDEALQLPPYSVDRLMKVAAFAVSPYSSTVGRTSKPFNPLLGETYELVHVEKGFRFISEKVSHHPTIIAAHAEGRGWRFEGDAEVKSRFWGRSIELKPEGVMRLMFRDGDTYCWNKVCTSINNLVLGKIYIDHGGIMKVRCLSENARGLTARIRFKESSVLFERDPRQVRGFIEQNGVRMERPILFGHWDDALYAEFEDGSMVELWKKSPPPADPTRYNLTSFAIQLNEITEGLEGRLAPTDSRLRPDQLFTEKGLWDEANAEKQRVEHKQRAARRAAERGEPLRPKWFSVLPAAAQACERSHSMGRQNSKSLHRGLGELAFSYKGGYWEARDAGDWTGCRDIFGPHVEQ